MHALAPSARVAAISLEEAMSAVPKANSHRDQLVGKYRPTDRLTEALMQKARGLWPRKTSAEVAMRAHVSPRAAERWMAGSREIGTEALACLLRSDQGIHFLMILMDRARPAWWSILLRMGLLGGIQRRREADLRLLRRVADADRTAAAELPTSLLFQDEDFYRPFLEAMGLPDRAMAQGRPR